MTGRALLLLIVMALQGAEFRQALPGYEFEFPRDHGSHPDFQLEWWYFTGHLDAAEKRFGYELTFFRIVPAEVTPTARSGGSSAWRIRDLYPAHFAISDLSSRRFLFAERINRAGPGLAGARQGRLEVWNTNWSARAEADLIHLQARTPEMRIELQLQMDRAPVIHGRDGVSQKAAGPGKASHYYSLTRLATSGELQIGEEIHPVSGESWMDHEFGSNQLADNQSGWDWFSLQFRDGGELMLYRMRRTDGSKDPFSAGTLISPEGAIVRLQAGDFEIDPRRTWTSPGTGISYPVAWKVTVPSAGIEVEVEALLDGQELNTVRSTGVIYWEGAIGFRGLRGGGETGGRGYAELTGYSEKYRPRF